MRLSLLQFSDHQKAAALVKERIPNPQFFYSVSGNINVNDNDRTNFEISNVVQHGNVVTKQAVTADQLLQAFAVGSGALAALVDNSRSSGRNGRSSNDFLGCTLYLRNQLTQLGKDGEGGNIQWMLYNVLIIIQNALSSVVFFFGPNPNAELVHERNGGFGIAPFDPENPDHVTIAAPYDNFIDMISVLVTKKVYREGLGKNVLDKHHGWKRNSNTVYGTNRYCNNKQCAHLFHKERCDWRISGPDRFGDEVCAEQQRKCRAARK